MADFYSARDSKGYRLRLNTWIHEQSIANNTTVVGYSVLMERNGNYSFATSGNRVTCTINGTQVVNTTVSADMTSAKSVTLAWGYTSAITHNADGTKSVSCSASFTPSSSAYYMPTSKTASGTYTLTTIPRASTVSVQDTNIGSSATINIARNSSDFTDTLTYSFSNLTGTIATKTSNTSVSWTVPTSFYAKIPNASSGVCTITCETFNGNTSLGTRTSTFNVLVDPSTNKPTVSGTIATTDTLSSTLTGGTSTIIRYVSTVQANITATGKNSATIASKLIKCGDGKQLTANGTMTKVGSGSFTFSATDSRGLTNSATVTKTLINYVPLTITGDATRPTPTSTTINVTLSGNYFNGSFGSQSNTLTIQYRTKLTSSSSWSSWTTLSGATTSGNTYTLSSKSIGTSFTYRNSYDVEVVAKDKVNTGTTVIFRKTVPSGTPVYWWNNNKFVHNTNVELQDGTVLDTALTNLINSLTYKSGDTYTLTQISTALNRYVATGFLTGGNKEIWFTITLPKDMGNLTPNITSLKINTRSATGTYPIGGTYVNGGTQVIGSSTYTVTYEKVDTKNLTIKILSSSSLGSTNNTPMSVAIENMTISFS